MSKEKKYNYLYETILVGSDKRYFGMHSSDTHPDKDSYKGSGTWVRGIKDKSKLLRTIIAYYDTIEELMIAEEQLIAEHIGKSYCMNYSPYSGGGCNLSGERHPQYGKRGELSHNFGRKHSVATRQKISEVQIGRQPTDEARQNMSSASKGKQKSEQHKKNISAAKSGEKHPLSKLTEVKVREIKILLRDTKLTYKEIGKIYNVNPVTIGDIKRGATWKHVMND